MAGRMELSPNCLHYTLKRQLLKLLGSTFRIYDDQGRLVAVTDQKAFKLKEDIRVYSDESRAGQLMAIRARQIIDFSAAYDIIDTSTNMKLGALRRKGLKSMFRDEWEVLDPNDAVIGKCHEDSLALALIRRFLSNLIPQNYDMVMFDGKKVVDFRQNFNPFTYHLQIDFSGDPQAQLDRRVGIAMAIMLAAIEGRQRG